ncbi:MAG TPA: S-adenosylmethionine:tRNA ribosyltransferase-isomerase [Casimicrobiaceae bacterium]|nr:S-adenosylmethionine:tRNA ribosyltransferase-isomerase [Casimicrobiaceae bacterium]
MIPASAPAQRPADAKLLVLAADGGLSHATRAGLAAYLRGGDVVVANDAATIPASLAGEHERTGATVEVRLAGWRSRIGDFEGCLAVVFGEGDYRTRTEQRPAAPVLRAGDRLRLGPLRATVVDILTPPRLVALDFDGGSASVWAGLAAHGRPIQYAHVPQPLDLWDVWTPLAAPPAAFEPPSAGFALDWRTRSTLRARGVSWATLTHAAGLSATGDDALDARLPLPEPYEIPAATVRAVARARACGGRVIAIGTTVVRALEHAASRRALRAGSGVADQCIGPATPLRVVDLLLTGTHEAGTSHYGLLGAFVNEQTLRAMSDALDAGQYRTHEFGDSVLVARELPCAAAVGW